MKKWLRVGKWPWRGDADAERKRLLAVRHFNTDARITKYDNMLWIYVWGTDEEIDAKIDWGKPR